MEKSIIQTEQAHKTSFVLIKTQILIVWVPTFNKDIQSNNRWIYRMKEARLSLVTNCCYSMLNTNESSTQPLKNKRRCSKDSLTTTAEWDISSRSSQQETMSTLASKAKDNQNVSKESSRCLVFKRNLMVKIMGIYRSTWRSSRASKN